jgi:dihydroxyacetone kinase-like protein
MVDALLPAVKALESAAEEGVGVSASLRRAAEAARKGARSTESMIARQGKARYLGERAVGHQDPGANSIALIMEALAEDISTEERTS